MVDNSDRITVPNPIRKKGRKKGCINCWEKPPTLYRYNWEPEYFCGRECYKKYHG